MVSGRERPVRARLAIREGASEVFDAYTGDTIDGLQRFIAAGSGDQEKLH